MSEERCKFCGSTKEVGQGVCDFCWYGMRLDRENWLKAMKELGVEIEKGMGCQITPGGIACGNPFKLKESPK